MHGSRIFLNDVHFDVLNPNPLLGMNPLPVGIQSSFPRHWIMIPHPTRDSSTFRRFLVTRLFHPLDNRNHILSRSCED